MPESQGLINIMVGIRDTSTGGEIVKTKNTALYNMVNTFNTNVLDTLSNSVGNIDIIHRKIHDGVHYVASIQRTATNDTDFINVFFLGQGSTEPKRHFVVEVTANQAGTIQLYEDILTSGGGGDTYTALNSDRGSTNASAHKIEIMGTTHSSSTGTLLWGQTFGANTPPIKSGGSASNREEFILNSSQDYELRYNPSAGAATIFINAEWYER